MSNNQKLRNIIDTTWSPKLAYAIGLIASDGWLRSDNMEIGFVSKDKVLVQNFKDSLNLEKDILRSSRSGTSGKRYWTLRFKSKQFHAFLQSVGITPAKSKTIKSVTVPNEYFADFFRGIYDGDGTFWTWWDKRWPNSFVFHIEIASASKQFIYWLQKRLYELFRINGHIKFGAGVYLLRFSKGDTRLLTKLMYCEENCLHLPRKYACIIAALDLDQKIKQNTGTPR